MRSYDGPAQATRLADRFRFRLRDTFTVLVRHLFRPVRRNDFRVFVHPPAAIVAAAQAQGLSVGYQHRALLWNLVGLERMAQPARPEPC